MQYPEMPRKLILNLQKIRDTNQKQKKKGAQNIEPRLTRSEPQLTRSIFNQAFTVQPSPH